MTDAMNSSVTPPQPPARAPLPKRRLLWIVLAAMALGLLMFLILMMTQRGQQPFFSAGPGDGTVDENGQVLPTTHKGFDHFAQDQDPQ